MDAEKRERLEKAGFRVGTVAEFLGLTQAQSDLIEIKLAFTDALKRQRIASGLSQSELAEKIGSSQSRIAKMEAGDPHVSLDLMIRALLAAGVTRGEMANVLTGKQSSLAGAEEHAAPPTSNGMERRRTAGKHAPPQAAP